MLAISKFILFSGHNHMLTTGADDLTLWLLPGRQPEHPNTGADDSSV